MSKAVPDAILDAMLDNFVGDAIYVCSAEPTDYTEASSTHALASDVISSGNYTDANGDTSGRKTTLAPPADSDITATGTGTHIAVTSGTTLLFVTTCTSVALTSGGTVTISSFDIEIGDPT